MSKNRLYCVDGIYYSIPGEENKYDKTNRILRELTHLKQLLKMQDPSLYVDFRKFFEEAYDLIEKTL